MRPLTVLHALGLMGLLLSNPAAAQIYSDAERQAAEDKLYALCADYSGNTEAECTCMIRVLRTELSPRDHRLVFDFMALSFKGEVFEILEFARRNKLDLDELSAFADRLGEVSILLDQDCEGLDLNGGSGGERL